MRRLYCLPVEAISGHAVILFASLHDWLFPLWVMDGIGEILGLQANAAALGIGNTAFSHGVGVVCCVKLDAGAVGADAHTPSAAGIG